MRGGFFWSQSLIVAYPISANGFFKSMQAKLDAEQKCKQKSSSGPTWITIPTQIVGNSFRYDSRKVHSFRNDLHFLR